MQAGNTDKTLFEIKNKLGLMPNLGRSATRIGDDPTTTPRMICTFTKNGAPATDTANDAPTGKGDLCWDSSNKAVYRCSAYVDTTHFTWTQIA